MCEQSKRITFHGTIRVRVCDAKLTWKVQEKRHHLASDDDKSHNSVENIIRCVRHLVVFAFDRTPKRLRHFSLVFVRFGAIVYEIKLYSHYCRAAIFIREYLFLISCVVCMNSLANVFFLSMRVLASVSLPLLSSWCWWVKVYRPTKKWFCVAIFLVSQRCAIIIDNMCRVFIKHCVSHIFM